MRRLDLLDEALSAAAGIGRPGVNESPVCEGRSRCQSPDSGKSNHPKAAATTLSGREATIGIRSPVPSNTIVHLTKMVGSRPLPVLFRMRALTGIALLKARTLMRPRQTGD